MWFISRNKSEFFNVITVVLTIENSIRVKEIVFIRINISLDLYF